MMIIDSSNIRLDAEQQTSETIEKTSRHERFINFLTAASPTTPASSALKTEGDEENHYSAGLQRFLSAGSAAVDKNPVDEARRLTQMETNLFDQLLEALTGKTAVKLENSPVNQTGSVLGVSQLQQPLNINMAKSIKVNVKTTETITSSECTQFNACGSVQTADGETIDLNLILEMSRSYSSTRSYESTTEIEFKDPLVINFDGTAADLTEETYEFDIDADGELDIINFLNSNSSLLALDQNADGTINDGSELFGAISGDGFADLAAYDEDTNGWIDEADSIFDELLLWRKVDGEDQLSSLADEGLGAIYLNAVDTPFELKNEANETRGQIRQSGIYLSENGQAGTVQQIDLAV